MLVELNRIEKGNDVRVQRMVDQELIRGLIEMMQELSIYETDFEPRLVKDTALFYEKEAKRAMNQFAVPAYLTFAGYRQTQEEIGHEYFPANTRKLLASIATQQLVIERAPVLIEKGKF